MSGEKFVSGPKWIYPDGNKLTELYHDYPDNIKEIRAEVEERQEIFKERPFKSSVKEYKIKAIGEIINFHNPNFIEEPEEVRPDDVPEVDMSIENVRNMVMTYIATRQEDTGTEEIVKFILKSNHVYTTMNDIKSEIWFYDEGIYIPNGQSRIKEIARDLLREAYTPQRSNKIIAKVEADTFIEHDEFFKNYAIDQIPVQNGILNVLTKELSEFSPDKVFFNKLPITFDRSKECPNIVKFFQDVLRDKEDAKVMMELIGFCLLKDYRFEKSAMFIGNGRNGKGKTLSLIKYFLGAENCSSIPLSQLVPSSTSVCELYGRLANLAGDLSNTDLKDTGMFKQVTGQDLITAKRKYLNDLFFTNYAKIMFACNELPKVYDLSDGFWSRWILFEFPYKFVREEEFNETPKSERDFLKIMDESIIHKLTTPEELSGLLNMALEGLERLIKNKGFSNSKGTEEIKDLWVRKSDSLTAFCIDCIEAQDNRALTKKEFRKAFHKYTKKHKLPGASDVAIKVTLENRYGAYDSQPMGGDRQWEGIKFKEDIDL